ncbi:M23 family metallopeptidase [Lachnospiraceae bacterium ZAX-1]
MRNRRAVTFLRQRSYVIAAVIMLAAAFGMTGVYFSKQSKAEKVKQQEMAAEEERLQAELAKEKAAEKRDSEAVSKIIPPKNNDFMDSPEDILFSGIKTNQDEIEDSMVQEVQLDTPLDKQEEVAEEEEAEQLKETLAVNTPELHFSAETDLNWPLQGNVILNYSMDQTIYFATLDQYKYNPAIIIAGEVNTKIMSVAKGQINSIETNEVTGRTVTIDLGDGYNAVYGQLKEIPFNVGDYIDSGEIIGYVSEPTKYFSVEGANIYFQLLKDGEPVNPMEYLD